MLSNNKECLIVGRIAGEQDVGRSAMPKLVSILGSLHTLTLEQCRILKKKASSLCQILFKTTGSQEATCVSEATLEEVTCVSLSDMTQSVLESCHSRH